LRLFEFVRIGVLRRLFDLSYDSFVRGNSFRDNTLNFYAREREEIGDFFNGFAGEIEVIGEPVE